jgi:hypothetical protein
MMLIHYLWLESDKRNEAKWTSITMVKINLVCN